jgi:hypothetical protein
MFINEAKPYDPTTATWRSNFTGRYKFYPTPKLLFTWSRLFQAVISQAGTYLLTDKFHDQQCSIYKTEGGCHLPGVGDLVLSKDHCYFDGMYGDLKVKEEKKLNSLADLITHVVLNWDPNNPIDSMKGAAVTFCKCTPKALQEALEKASNGGVFGGNALADFFDWNPFSEAPIDRAYLRFSLVNFNGKTEAEVDQKFADEDLGKDLLKKINDKIKSCPANLNQYLTAMCCSPRRGKEGLTFWINTGRQTVIDGAHTEESIKKFLDSNGALHDKARY